MDTIHKCIYATKPEPDGYLVHLHVCHPEKHAKHEWLHGALLHSEKKVLGLQHREILIYLAMPSPLSIPEAEMRGRGARRKV